MAAELGVVTGAVSVGAEATIGLLWIAWESTFVERSLDRAAGDRRDNFLPFALLAFLGRNWVWTLLA